MRFALENLCHRARDFRPTAGLANGSPPADRLRLRQQRDKRASQLRSRRLPAPRLLEALRAFSCVRASAKTNEVAKAAQVNRPDSAAASMSAPSPCAVPNRSAGGRAGRLVIEDGPDEMITR